ncbi:hypothetical protein CWB59_05280, partial [Pseudoalteromonas sp. S326]|uniref:hypothetical protein n=1 Tax=Pseudoalteromonas sp. S326 TaxID=579533 RepID=UPI001285AAEA
VFGNSELCLHHSALIVYARKTSALKSLPFVLVSNFANVPENTSAIASKVGYRFYITIPSLCVYNKMPCVLHCPCYSLW